MALYDEYKHLLGLPYVDGTQDCYGLARAYYRDVYGITLGNYARSTELFFAGISLFDKHMVDEGFAVVDVPLDQLQKGDGILMAVRWKTSNHCGVYVGNGLMIHHLYGKPSREDGFTPLWRRTVMSILRHPDIAELNAASRKPTQFIDILPDHVKAKHGIQT